MSTCFLLEHWYYGDKSDPVAVYLDEQAADRESERLNELLDGNRPKRTFRADRLKNQKATARLCPVCGKAWRDKDAERKRTKRRMQ